MAVVGEARIIVRAITTGVGDEIERGLKDGEARASKSGDRMGKSLNDGIKRATGGKNNAFSRMFDSDGAERTRQAYVALQKAGFNLQTGAGVLAGSLGALVGGLGGLVGAAGNASGALAGLAGTFVGLKIGASLAGMALGGVSAAFGKATGTGGALRKTAKELAQDLRDLRFAAEESALGVDRAGLNLEKAKEGLARVADLAPNNRLRREAELAVKEAELALRKAKDESQEAADKAKAGPKQAAGGGADPYAGLTKSQATFAKTLVGLKPKFDELKEAVAKGFLPALDTQIRKLMSGEPFEILKNGFTGIGKALGDSATYLGDFITSARGLENMRAILGTSEYVVRGLGKAFTNAFGSFTDILKAADPMTRRFVDFIEGKTGLFDKFLQTDKGKSGLSKFLAESERVAKDFGDIFGNIFKGIGKLMEANFGPGSGGDIMIQGLKKATESFANLDKMAGGKSALRQYFIDTAKNTNAIFGAVGALLKEFIKLGSLPEIKDFFDILKSGAPLMGEILKSGIEAGPSLARLIVSLTRITAVLADSGAIKVFFDTLNAVASAVADVLENKTVRAFLDVIGKVAAFALALGTIVAIASKVGAVLLATFGRVGIVFGPLFFIVAAIAGAFILLYQNSAEARKQMDELAASFMEGFGEIATMASGLMAEIGPVLMDALSVITDALMDLLPVIKDQLMPAFFDLIKSILPLIPVIVESLVPAFTKIIAAVMPMVVMLLTSLMPAIDAILKAVVPLITALVDMLVPIFEVLIAVIDPVVQILLFLATIILQTLLPPITIIVKIFAAMASFVAASLVPAIKTLGEVFRFVFAAIQAHVKSAMNKLIGFAEGFINFFIDGINGMIGALNKFKIAVPEALRTFTNGAKEIGFNINPVAKIKLARLADGGTVMPTPGGTFAQIAEAGRPERVEPLDPNGLSNRDKAMIELLSGGTSGRQISIVVNPSAGMDEKALANEISRQLAFQIRRGGV